MDSSSTSVHEISSASSGGGAFFLAAFLTFLGRAACAAKIEAVSSQAALTGPPR